MRASSLIPANSSVGKTDGLSPTGSDCRPHRGAVIITVSSTYVRRAPGAGRRQQQLLLFREILLRTASERRGCGRCACPSSLRLGFQLGGADCVIRQIGRARRHIKLQANCFTRTGAYRYSTPAAKHAPVGARGAFQEVES